MTTKVRTIGQHELTPEMNSVIEAILSGKSIKAYAYAGSGKSTLLRSIEKYYIDKKGLYICFNKSLEEEARTLFSGHNVNIATAHAFALNSFSRKERQQFLKKVSVKHSTDTVLKHSDLTEDHELCKKLGNNKAANYLLKTINAFCLTASKELNEQHIPEMAIKAIDQLIKKDQIKTSQREHLFESLVKHSQILLKSMFDTNSDCPATHDAYLKRWQLSEPKFDYDYLMFDEAQDANPLLLSVILRQPCQQIFVGDQYQSLYQFRGGIDAMNIIPHESYPLSHSFRFGQRVADLATKVLRHLDPDVCITGSGYDTEVITGSRYNDTHAFLFIAHTNASLLEALLTCYQANIPASFVSNKANFSLRKLNSMMRISAGQESPLEQHHTYTSLEHLLLNEKDSETQLFGEWIKKDYAKATRLHEALAWSLNIPHNQSKVTLSTAHGSKGLENDVVMLSDDFKAVINAFGHGKPLDASEIHSLYVALTRAKKVLVIPDELMAALEKNLAFSVNHTNVDTAALDNVLPAHLMKQSTDIPEPELEDTSAKTSAQCEKKTQTADSRAGHAQKPELGPGSKKQAQAQTKPEPSQRSTTTPDTKKTGSHTESTGSPDKSICVEVGISKTDQSTPLFWKPTDTQEYLNPNLAIIGTMGTGKTQTTKSIVTQLVRQRHLNTDNESLGMLIFDYKSDYSEAEFVNATGALVLEPSNMPINPFALHGKNRLTPVTKAMEIADTLATIYKLGVKQKSTLKKLVIASYERRNIYKGDIESFCNTPPTLNEVIRAYFSQEKVPEDTLSSALSDLDDFEIFEPNPRRCQSLFDLLDNQVVVIKLGGLSSSMQNLIVALLLGQFYLQMHQSPKPVPKDAHRALKKVILVDEADQFLSQDFVMLKKILQEGREFGVGTILSTQSLDHFNTGEEKYAKSITSWICHRLNNPNTRDVKPLLNLDDQSEFEDQLRTLRKLPKHESLFVDGQKKIHYQQSTAFYRLSY